MQGPDGVDIEHFQTSPNDPELKAYGSSFWKFAGGIRIELILKST
jgi:hypothetical protein